ncbi:MAG: hypothetical protein J7K08_05960 [Thermoplasmata archaeon]|nr:hypothetical protein [Thermoplasmata archaeon]
MKKTYGIRLEDDVRAALNLASSLTHTPVSKLISPFIEEGTKVLLGSLLLLMVDREAVIDKKQIQEFVRECTGPSTKEVRVVPPLVKRMEDIFSREEVLSELKRAFPQVEFSPSVTLRTKGALRDLLEEMGEEYLRRGGSLRTLDIKIAVDAFFRAFIERFYRSSARGNMEVLLSSWRAGSRELLGIQQMAYRIYTKEVKLTPVEAIEIGVFKKME